MLFRFHLHFLLSETLLCFAAPFENRNPIRTTSIIPSQACIRHPPEVTSPPSSLYLRQRQAAPTSPSTSHNSFSFEMDSLLFRIGGPLAQRDTPISLYTTETVFPRPTHADTYSDEDEEDHGLYTEWFTTTTAVPYIPTSRPDAHLSSRRLTAHTLAPTLVPLRARNSQESYPITATVAIFPARRETSSPTSAAQPSKLDPCDVGPSCVTGSLEARAATETLPLQQQQELERRKAPSHVHPKLTEITQNGCGLSCMLSNLHIYNPEDHERKSICPGYGYTALDNWWMDHVQKCVKKKCPSEVQRIHDDTVKFFNGFCGGWPYGLGPQL